MLSITSEVLGKGKYYLNNFYTNNILQSMKTNIFFNNSLVILKIFIAYLILIFSLRFNAKVKELDIEEEVGGLIWESEAVTKSESDFSLPVPAPSYVDHVAEEKIESAKSNYNSDIYPYPENFSEHNDDETQGTPCLDETQNSIGSPSESYLPYSPTSPQESFSSTKNPDASPRKRKKLNHSRLKLNKLHNIGRGYIACHKG